MKKHWISSCFTIGTLLLIAPGALSAREPKPKIPAEN